MREDADVRRVSTLKVDKDCYVDKAWISEYATLLVTICWWHRVKVNSIKMCPSHSKGLHFYVAVSPPVSAELANRLQWLFGDDCRRVDFNRARINSGLEEWNKLFEKPDARLITLYRTRTKAVKGPDRRRRVGKT